MRVLTDHYLKAVAFFWLLGTIVTSTERLRTHGVDAGALLDSAGG